VRHLCMFVLYIYISFHLILYLLRANVHERMRAHTTYAYLLTHKPKVLILVLVGVN
jgi:hypothetical protein